MSGETTVKELGQQQKPKKDNWLTRFIDKIAEANEKKFGGQIPDCCGNTRPAHPAGKTR